MAAGGTFNRESIIPVHLQERPTCHMRAAFSRSCYVSSCSHRALRTAHAPPAFECPNILHIMSDDHSFPHLGCYGNPDIKTPNLDHFAAQGIRGPRLCRLPPVRAVASGIMTGRSPVDIDMSRFSAPLPRERPHVSRASAQGRAITPVLPAAPSPQTARRPPPIGGGLR